METFTAADWRLADHNNSPKASQKAKNVGRRAVNILVDLSKMGVKIHRISFHWYWVDNE
jgi:hypothetical protein